MIERTEFEQWRSKEVARLLALVETERRYYQELVAALPAPLAVLAADQSLMWANRSFRRVFGLRADDLRRRDVAQILPIPGLADIIREAREKGTTPEPLAIQVGGQPSRLAIVPLRGVHGSDADESEDETLLMLEMGLDTDVPASQLPSIPGHAPEVTVVVAPRVPRSLPAVVWQADADTFQIRSAGGAVEELLGFTADHWKDTPNFFEERIHPEDRQAVLDLYREAVSKGGDAAAEFRAVNAAGQAVWCRESIRVAPAGSTPGAARGVSGILTLVGLRKQFEQQALLAARMDGLQALAGRLAHDLNNPLMIITGYAEEMLQSLSATNPLRADAVEIMTATERISALAAKLGEFTRRPLTTATATDLGALLESLETQIRSTAGMGVILELAPAIAPVWAVADREQLTEVILTLLAADREGAQDRSRVTISCGADRLMELVGGDPASGATLKPGKYAYIMIRDDGRGLDAQRLAAIFDPTFALISTAKSNPTATGVALARVIGLVRQWGGEIACLSEPNRGTTFSIYLPYVEPVEAPTTAEVPAEAPPVEPLAEPEPMRETVLVVDDEAGIRGLMRKILSREHYDVLEAASAEDALDQAVSHHGPIHLLVTDVMLPGMLGPELARHLYELDSKLKVLYISGYTEDEGVRSGAFPPGARFLAKPFTLGALLGKVRETLDANQ